MLARITVTAGRRVRLGAPSTIGTRSYHENIIDHYENPRNVGSLDKSSSDVGTGLVGAPACGDVMKVQLEVRDGVVVDAKFKTFGCGSAIASSSVATEWLKGREVEDCLSIKVCQLLVFALPLS
jgi:iron-sulfur cluster assembly enzyme ISCU, mitochondrial